MQCSDDNVISLHVRPWNALGKHISNLEQEFQRRTINSISLYLLASEFNVESKNMNRFAGERHDFFGQNSKGVPH